MHPPTSSDVGEIHLLPIGTLPGGFLDALAARISRRLLVACRTRGARSGALPMLGHRDQVDADALLREIEAGATAGAILVGVTAQDLATPIFTYVFGMARVLGGAAVVSLARLDPAFYGLPPSEGLLVTRAEAETLHELGHAAGLGHCRDPLCLMAFAGTVEKADARGSAFCARCAGGLPRWLRPAHEPPPRA